MHSFKHANLAKNLNLILALNGVDGKKYKFLTAHSAKYSDYRILLDVH